MGFPCWIDTAGLRSKDPIEMMGIERSELVAKTDLIHLLPSDEAVSETYKRDR